MRRLTAVIFVAACVAALGTWVGAAPAREAGPATAQAKPKKLPPLPAEVKGESGGTSR